MWIFKRKVAKIFSSYFNKPVDIFDLWMGNNGSPGELYDIKHPILLVHITSEASYNALTSSTL